jgi:TolB-like protein/cytochrome c-type biogenesis protein CcmH/NrfG
VRAFFSELKRRKVYRVAIAYALAAWVIAQVVTQIFPVFEVSPWALRLMISLLILGFPVALVLAWAFDITPEGIKRTDDDLEPRETLTRPAENILEKSIAVLPFENLGDDPENAYFADGVHDDILSSLAKISDLKVISRTSVRQYREGARNLREIGQALGVAHILEGTVRRAGSRVRINAQLINARSDTQIWAETFDRKLTNLFALQSELAERITAALRANLSARERASIQVHPTKDLAAYELFLRARDLFHWSGVGDPLENGEKALLLIDQAVARDPQFPLAYCLASRVNAELYWFAHQSRARLDSAKAAADVALRLQPDLGEAHLAMAFFHYYGYRDYERAQIEIEIAQRATPNDAQIWDGAGAISRRAGRWNEAIANFEKARYLDPRNFSVISNLAETLIAMRRYEEAERAIDNALLVNPNAHLFSIARAAIDLRRNGDTARLRAALDAVPRDYDPGGAVATVRIRLSLMQRDFAEAARTLGSSVRERFMDSGCGGTAGMIDGYPFPKSWYTGLLARAHGDVNAARHAFQEARRVVEADLAQWPDDVKSTIMAAFIHAALGRKDDALSDGRRAVELLPIARDTYDGLVLATNLAAIYAQVGERDLAVEQLAALIELPNGPTPGTLSVEPEWDALHGDPRFDKLVAQSAKIAAKRSDVSERLLSQ